MKKPTLREFIKLNGTAASVNREDVLKFYPNTPSKVIQAHHAGVWDGEALAPEIIHQMLDESITALTGLNDACEAWSILFSPDEWIAIKVNTLFSQDCTHLSLVMAIVQSLQNAGIPPEQIILYDRWTHDLEQAGYPVNENGPGVRCHGANYTAGWMIADTDIGLVSVLLECDALINVPILTGVVFAGMGISFAISNHFGTELDTWPSIKDRTRLVIGDILTADTYQSHYGRLVVGGSKLLMSFDPVALDTIGTQIAAEAYAAEGLDSADVTLQATSWLAHAAELGLGTNDMKNIDLVEVDLV
jgi:hypothetical protein